MKIKKIGEILKPPEPDILKKEVNRIKDDEQVINSEKNLNILKENSFKPYSASTDSSSKQMYYILGSIIFVILSFIMVYFVFINGNNNDKVKINPKTVESKETLQDTLKKETTINKISFKDTLVAINKVTKQFSNGYLEILYNQNQIRRVKIPSDKITVLVNNLKDYRVKYKIIPYGEDGKNDDYSEFVIDIKTGDKIPIMNKYSINDEVFNAILNVTLKEEALRSECFAKVKNKRDIIDVEMFDLNSDGQDEYIVWCVNNSCFVYNHCQDVYVLEKVESNLLTLFNSCTEGIEITNKVSNGYFIIDESGIAGRGRDVPEEAITTLKFNGTKYIASGTRYKKINID